MKSIIYLLVQRLVGKSPSKSSSVSGVAFLLNDNKPRF